MIMKWITYCDGTGTVFRLGQKGSNAGPYPGQVDGEDTGVGV